MSQETTDAVRRLYDALNSGDAEGVMACLDPEIEFWEPEVLPHGGPRHGHEGMQAFLGEVMETYENPHLELERIHDAGDVAVTEARFSGTVRSTGESLDVPMVEVVRVRDGRWVEARVYPETATMLAALGQATAA